MKYRDLFSDRRYKKDSPGAFRAISLFYQRNSRPAIFLRVLPPYFSKILYNHYPEQNRFRNSHSFLPVPDSHTRWPFDGPRIYGIPPKAKLSYLASPAAVPIRRNSDPLSHPSP